MSTPKTFQAHGFTWTAHTPGDPMPCDGNKMVCILLQSELHNRTYDHDERLAKYYPWESKSTDEDSRVVGWYYANNPQPSKPASAWRPIAEAPMDGTHVDLWVAGEYPQREANAYFGKPSHCCGEMGQYCDSDWHSEEPGWIGYYDMPVTGKITHWMPLPDPPAD